MASKGSKKQLDAIIEKTANEYGLPVNVVKDVLNSPFEQFNNVLEEFTIKNELEKVNTLAFYIYGFGRFYGKEYCVFQRKRNSKINKKNNEKSG